MDEKHRIIIPQSVTELLHAVKREPQALIYAGGSFIPAAAVERPIISLHAVEELKKISRTDRTVEIGAAAAVGRLLELGGGILPPAFSAALRAVTPPNTRYLATVGGNLCLPGRVLTIAPVLSLMEAKIEIRRSGGSRWVPAGRFRDAAGLRDLRAGEVVTRIRLPLGRWNCQVFRRMEGRTADGGSGGPQAATGGWLSGFFVGLARIEKQVAEDIRLVCCLPRYPWIRDRELEAGLIGRRIPIGRADAVQLAAALAESLPVGETAGEPADAAQLDAGVAPGGAESADFDLARVRRVAQWFFANVHNSGPIRR